MDKLKTEDKVRQYVASLGGEVLSIRKKNHWVVLAAFEDIQLWLTVPVTPSCPRAMRNNSSWVRRRVKEARAGR
jgi:hypothetical protein